MLNTVVARADDTILSLHEAAAALGLHYMTVYRYVRTGRLAATKDGAQWRVRARDVEQLRAPANASRPRRGAAIDDSARSGLEARMVAGDNAGAWQLVESRLAGGLDPAGVLNDLITPVLRTIGERWSAGDLSVADEHRATAVAQKLIGRLGLQFGRRGRRRGTVVLAAPAGDLHTLPVAIAADLLRWRSFNVIELGAHTPATSLGEVAAKAPRLQAVGIVATTPGLTSALKEAVAAVRAAAPGIPVLLGGGAIKSRTAARRLGADVYTGRDGTTLVDAVEAIAGGTAP